MCSDCCSAVWRWLFSCGSGAGPSPSPPPPPRQRRREDGGGGAEGDVDDDERSRLLRPRHSEGVAPDDSARYTPPPLVLADGGADGGGAAAPLASAGDGLVAAAEAAAAEAAAAEKATTSLINEEEGAASKPSQQREPAAAGPAPVTPRPGDPPPARLSRGGLNAVSAAAAAGAPSSGSATAGAPSSASASATPATILVMRHGHRQDEADPTWTRVAARPWDPPLSDKGRMQARDAALALVRGGGGGGGVARIDVVVTSPFRRCLQTSAEAAAALGLPQGRWFADWGLSEVCDPRVLLHGRPDCEHAARGRPLGAWMWGGATLEEALGMFAEAGESLFF